MNLGKKTERDGRFFLRVLRFPDFTRDFANLTNNLFDFRARRTRIIHSRARISRWTRKRKACGVKRRGRPSINSKKPGWVLCALQFRLVLTASCCVFFFSSDRRLSIQSNVSSSSASYFIAVSSWIYMGNERKWTTEGNAGEMKRKKDKKRTRRDANRTFLSYVLSLARIF